MIWNFFCCSVEDLVALRDVLWGWFQAHRSKKKYFVRQTGLWAAGYVWICSYETARHHFTRAVAMIHKKKTELA